MLLSSQPKKGRKKDYYAKRSMIGAQFLLEMRARRSRRAFSISFKYPASIAMRPTIFTILILRKNKNDRFNLLSLRLIIHIYREKYEMQEWKGRD